MKVMITGAGGFIGTHLVEDQLKRERQVVALDVDTSALAHLSGDTRLEIIKGDVRDAELLDRIVGGVDVVFHLASIHLSVGTSDEVYRSVNVGGTKALLEACHRKGVRRFIHCSSVGVYGKIQDPPADEKSCCSPESIYDVTKLEGEMQALQFHRVTGFPVVVVRPAWVYGPGCPRTRKLFRAIKHGKFFLVGNGTTHRHGIYVKDVVEGFEVCAHNDTAVGQIYILADERAVTVKELVGNIATTLGVSSPQRRVPFWMVYPVCLGAEGVFKLLKKDPPLSRRTLSFFASNTSFDTSKAKTELGFAARVSLEEGLRVTYDQIRVQEGL